MIGQFSSRFKFQSRVVTFESNVGERHDGDDASMTGRHDGDDASTASMTGRHDGDEASTNSLVLPNQSTRYKLVIVCVLVVEVSQFLLLVAG